MLDQSRELFNFTQKYVLLDSTSTPLSTGSTKTSSINVVRFILGNLNIQENVKNDGILPQYQVKYTMYG